MNGTTNTNAIFARYNRLTLDVVKFIRFSPSTMRRIINLRLSIPSKISNMYALITLFLLTATKGCNDKNKRNNLFHNVNLYSKLRLFKTQ